MSRAIDIKPGYPSGKSPQKTLLEHVIAVRMRLLQCSDLAKATSELFSSYQKQLSNLEGLPMVIKHLKVKLVLELVSISRPD